MNPGRLRSAGKSFAGFMGIAPMAKCYASSINQPDLMKRLSDHAQMGQTEFKLKIGFDADKDEAFLEAATQNLPVGARLTHFGFEGGAFFGFDQRVIGADQGQDAGLDGAGLRRCGGT